MLKLYVVIMAGGSGTRFWPLSRENRPKQFLDILGTGRSLLQMTYDRFLKVCPAEQIMVVTGEKYAGLVKEHLPGLAGSRLLTEPLRRNTAPCIAYAAYKLAALDPGACMVVAPSDHLILNEDLFAAAIHEAVQAASRHDRLLTLGIRPTRPDTGYGYVQYIKDGGAENAYKVKTFTEKPDLELAQTFLKSGDFLWNSGMFIWKISAIIEAYRKYLPEMSEVFEKGSDAYNTPEEKEFIRDSYTKCTNISVDYGIMEKAPNVYVIPAAFGWSDLGAWTALYEKLDKDYLGNAVIGKNVMVYESENCIVAVPDDKLVVLQGLRDFIVVESDNILLIIPKSEEQNIKQILSDVKRNKGDKYL